MIIDEYDNFTNQLITSHQDKLYGELTTGDSFLRTFFKVIKAGVGEGRIGRVFITGVLPITIDDLTSGFNIAEIITLEPGTLNMMGFTQAEVDHYLTDVFDEYGFDHSRLTEIKELVRNYYNGYRFLPDTEESLYNSTILNHFLKRFTINKGTIPRDFIDENLRVDINWIRRLTGGDEKAREMLETLVLKEELPYDMDMLNSKFNMNQLFQKRFYPVSLFYLGMMTTQDQFSMTFPNQSLRKIFTEYFNELENFSVSEGYTDYFRSFLKILDLEQLFAGYWTTYVGQIPAQAFDKMNKNFFRTTFYELCTRYLSQDFTFAIEVNYPSGRSDWEMLGKYHSNHRDMKYLLEFKYFSNEKGKKDGILDLEKALPQDIKQTDAYAKDIHKVHPEYNITKHIVYIVGNMGYRFFSLNQT